MHVPYTDIVANYCKLGPVWFYYYYCATGDVVKFLHNV